MKLNKAQLKCPYCESNTYVKNGYIHNGKQKYKCKNCHRQFVENPKNKPISMETKAMVDNALSEKTPLAEIARTLGVSNRWLQYYVKRKYENTPQEVTVKSKKIGESNNIE